MEIKIINRSGHALPAYQTAGSAGVDLRAHLEQTVILEPMQRKLIPTGLYIELPEGYEAQVRPRSGLALKHGITVLNSPGTIDADYRGEISVLLINLSAERFEVANGERIAQMVIAKHEVAQFVLVEELSQTERGTGGYGSTGKKQEKTVLPLLETALSPFLYEKMHLIFFEDLSLVNSITFHLLSPWEIRVIYDCLVVL